MVSDKQAAAAVWFSAALMLGAALSGSVAADDQIAPVNLARDAPGMVRYDSCAAPVYPPEEAALRHEGRVLIRFYVGTDGKVIKSSVMRSSAYPALDAAALLAIAKCRFNPPMAANGKAVAAWVPVEYEWRQ